MRCCFNACGAMIRCRNESGKLSRHGTRAPAAIDDAWHSAGNEGKDVSGALLPAIAHTRVHVAGNQCASVHKACLASIRALWRENVPIEGNAARSRRSLTNRIGRRWRVAKSMPLLIWSISVAIRALAAKVSLSFAGAERQQAILVFQGFCRSR